MSKPNRSNQQNKNSNQNDKSLMQLLEGEFDIFHLKINDFKKIRIENGFVQFVRNFKVSIFDQSNQITNYSPIFLSHFYKENPSSFNLEYIVAQINFYTKNRNFSLASLQGFSEGEKEDGFIPIILTTRPANGPLSSFFGNLSFQNSEQKFLIICGIVHGITFIHENGFIHSNLNPTTVYIDENNFPSICDYIFVPPFKVTTVKRKNKEGKSFKFSDVKQPFLNFFQNPIYVAPEIQKGEEFDQSSDIYSLGMLIFYILFEKDAELKNGKIANYPSDLNKLWKELIDSCINNVPQNRPRSLMILKKLIDVKNIESFVSSIEPNSVKLKISTKGKNYLKLIQIDIQNEFKTSNVKFDIIDKMIFNINDIDFETRLVIQGAENGDIECIEKVADFFNSGKNNFIKDKHSCFLCYEQGANKGSLKSLKDTAFRCEQGIGTPKNLDKSMALYKKALELVPPNDAEYNKIKGKIKTVDDDMKAIKLKNIPLNVSRLDIWELFKDYDDKNVIVRQFIKGQFIVIFITEDELHRAERDIREKKILIGEKPIEFILLKNEIEESNPYESLTHFLPKINLENYYKGKEIDYFRSLFGDMISETYLAYEKSTEQCFPAKIFNRIRGEELIKSVQREVILTSKLNHPSIIKYVGFSEFNLLYKERNEPTLLMKIIPKYNLEYTIDIKPRWWDNTIKLKVIIGIASALCHMFLSNVSHYNLNTENIYLDEKAEPVICNFGYLNKLIIDEQKKNTKYSQICMHGP